MPLRALALPCLLLATLVALGACSKQEPPAPPLAWEVVADVPALEQALAKARAEGKPAVVHMTASWCGPCHVLDRFVEDTPAVRRRLSHMARLRVDVSASDRPDLRAVVGLQRGTPQMVFFRKDGTKLDEHVLGADRRATRTLEKALERAF